MSQTEWIQILTAGIGALGFCLFSHMHLKHFFSASLGGLMAWAVYLALSHVMESLFLATLLAAMAAYIWSEIMARLGKAPVTIFLVPGILPLLPGSFLYYTTLALLNSQNDQFRYYCNVTITVTMGIACGVVIASIMVNYLIQAIDHFKGKKAA
jgi:uncharacterized membrane protein YjjB (DUF3815 family)